MTKHTFLLFGAFFAFCNLIQGQDTVRTLFKPSKVKHFGLYVAPEFQYGQIDNRFTPFSGVSGMLLFNRRLAVGVTGMRSLDESFSPSSVTPLVLRSYFGGGKIEYTLKPYKMLHLTFPLVAGMGISNADSLNSRIFGHHHGFDFDGEGRGGRNNRGNHYFMVQPGVHLEVNVLRNMQVFAGVNYRFSSKVGNTTTNTQLPNNLMQGASLSAGVKVGFFAIGSKKRHSRNTPPDAVLNGFMEKFPNAPANVRWHREHQGVWEAEFSANDAATAANFDANGQWLETETAITLADLPVALQTAMKDVKTKEINKIQKADGTVIYEVETKRKALLFDENGIIIMQH